jgi:hypothetical protein
MSEDGLHPQADSNNGAKGHKEKDQQCKHRGPQDDHEWGQHHSYQASQHRAKGRLFWMALEVFCNRLRPHRTTGLLGRTRQPDYETVYRL